MGGSNRTPKAPAPQGPPRTAACSREPSVEGIFAGWEQIRYLGHNSIFYLLSEFIRDMLDNICWIDPI